MSQFLSARHAIGEMSGKVNLFRLGKDAERCPTDEILKILMVLLINRKYHHSHLYPRTYWT